MGHLNRHRRRLVVIAVVLIAVCLILVWPIPVYSVNLKTSIPQNARGNPLYSVAETAISTNTTGNAQLTVRDFNYTSSDGTTRIVASSGTMQVTMIPIAQNETRLDLNVQLNGVSVTSPSYSGRVSSVLLSGFVIVDSKTNHLVVSMTASTSIGAIIAGFLA